MVSIPRLRWLFAGGLISLTAAVTLPAGEPRLGSSNTTLGQLDNDLSFTLTDPWPAGAGMPPQFKLRSSWRLRKRECLENGSNYCFGNNIDFCPDCGGCCSLDGDQWCCPNPEASCCPGQTCCEPGTTCCGEGCCADGQQCTDGKCEVPLVTVTETKTAHTTQTHTKVEMVTVEMKVVETSTINSIVTETITSAEGTQTEITYVTTTVTGNAKRSVPTSPLVARRKAKDERPRSLVERTALYLWRNLVYGGQQAPFDATITQISPTEPRQCVATTTMPDLVKRQAATSTTTVFTTTTIVDHTTINEKKTTTTEVTSVFKTTIFQTSTKVVGAKATVSTTSTITITSRTATTQTVTSTSTFIDSPTETASPDGSGGGSAGQDGQDPDTSNKDKKKGLSTSAIIGIGVGAGLLALTLAIVAFFLWRRRQKKKQNPRPYDFTYTPTPQMTSPRQPTLPFVPAAAHHESSYTPTMSELNSEPTPDSLNKTAGAEAGAAAAVGAGAAATGRGHTRNSSVNKPLLTSGQTSPDPYRESVTSGSHQSWPTNASEMPTEVRYELGETGAADSRPQSQQPPPPQQPSGTNLQQQYRTGPHPSTSSISRVTRFAELEGGAGGGRMRS